MDETEHHIVIVEADDAPVITCACGRSFDGYSVAEARQRYEAHRPSDSLHAVK